MRIRAMVLPWFDGGHGMRGAFLGPLIFLGAGPYGYRVLEFVAVIRRDAGASRVVGLTYPFLFSLLALVGLAAGAIQLVLAMHDGRLHAMGVIPALAIMAAAAALILWLIARGDQHRNWVVERLEAEFDGQREPQLIAPTFPDDPALSMCLDISGLKQLDPVSMEQLDAAIAGLADGTEEFLILWKEEHLFMQTAREGNFYTLEWRNEGDIRPMIAQRTTSGKSRLFTIDEVRIALVAYLHGGERHEGVKWV